MIELDGSQGEGGGQILRTALTLSMCTGKAVHLTNIRAKRKSPGLKRQHLTSVQAAAAISNAEIEGATIGSTEIIFSPKEIKGGNYRFSISTAGSCTLVLQTILPALIGAKDDSHITLHGGTHNPMSPPFHFLQRSFIPLLNRMGAKVEINLNRFGFYPAGGGEITAEISGGQSLTPLSLSSRGDLVKAYAESLIAALPMHIAERELAVVKKRMGWNDEQLILHPVDGNQGPGNALLMTLEYEHITETFTGFAEKGVPAETVANGVIEEAQGYISSEATVGSHLADQVLLPMALAGGGSFVTTDWSQHAETNADVIRQFVDVEIQIEKMAGGTMGVRLGVPK